MKDIRNFPLFNSEMTFFSSPFRILSNNPSESYKDPSYFSQLTIETRKLVLETTPFYTFHHIESEEHSKFFSILFDHLQPLDQYQFSSPPIFFNEIPLPHMKAF
jgi:hypothetical protein